MLPMDDLPIVLPNLMAHVVPLLIPLIVPDHGQPGQPVVMVAKAEYLPLQPAHQEEALLVQYLHKLKLVEPLYVMVQYDDDVMQTLLLTMVTVQHMMNVSLLVMLAMNGVALHANFCLRIQSINVVVMVTGVVYEAICIL